MTAFERPKRFQETFTVVLIFNQVSKTDFLYTLRIWKLNVGILSRPVRLTQPVVHYSGKGLGHDIPAILL